MACIAPAQCASVTGHGVVSREKVCLEGDVNGADETDILAQLGFPVQSVPHLHPEDPR